MEFTVNEIAQQVDGEVIGNGDTKIYKAAKIEEAQHGDLSFVANGKYASFAFTSKASALLVNRDFDINKSNGKAIILVENVYEALSIIVEKFEKNIEPKGISHLASIHEEAKVGNDLYIGDFSIVAQGAQIADHVSIGENCNIGRNVIIGKNTKIYPGVRIYHECIIGDNCIIHANTVIGCDGFGFAITEESTFKKIPQIGNVIIEDDVEIGANCVIDRGSMGSTIIRSGVKLDNLIQVAHNVEIGQNTVIAAQTGIAGSTKIGKQCMIGGQVGIVGHITIADGTQIQGQSGVAASITEKNKKWYGFPAIPYYKYLRAFSIFKILPNLLRRLDKIEEKLEQFDHE